MLRSKEKKNIIEYELSNLRFSEIPRGLLQGSSFHHCLNRFCAPIMNNITVAWRIKKTSLGT